MQKRAVRLTVVALLVLTGLGASVFTWNTHRRIEQGLARERDVDARLDRLMRASAALGGAQQAAVTPGQAHAEWLSRGASQLQLIYDESSALRSQTRSASAQSALAAFDASLDAVVKADTRAREHLRSSQELMAADVIFTEGRQGIDELIAVLADLEQAERIVAEDDRRALLVKAASGLGAAAAIWLVGVFALVRVPKVSRGHVASTARGAALAMEGPMLSAPQSISTINITAAAEVCTAMSRVTRAAELPGLLGRAAAVLDASGIIVWLGAGEELFPVASHGYSARVVSRLGAIPRAADNATAIAWRTGELRVVAGDTAANGAVVAPLFGPDGCIGVLATEVRHGREHDENTRAVTTMIAAQLAAIVAAWPAPSGVEGPAHPVSSASDNDAAAVTA